MKNPSTLSLIALVFSTIALGIMLLSSPFFEAQSSSEDLQPADTHEKLLTRIEALVEENQALRDRMNLLELRSNSNQRAPIKEDFVSEQDFAQFRREMRELLSQQSLAWGTPATVEEVEQQELSSVFTAQVAKALEQIRNEEVRKETQSWVSDRSERLAKRMPEVVNELGLASYQQEVMENALTSLYQRQADTKLSVTSGEVGRREVGKAWRADIESLMTELGGVLTPQQLEAYQALEGDLFPDGNGGKK